MNKFFSNLLGIEHIEIKYYILMPIILLAMVSAFIITLPWRIYDATNKY